LVWLLRIGTSDSGVAIRKIRFSSRFSMELDSGGLLQLLSRMKEEHARSAAAIEALDRSAAESSRRLEHQRETIDRMGEDVNQIVAKTLQSAGSARQVSEVRPLHPPAKVSLPSPSLARAALSSFPHVRPLQL
jgi:methyl-accepting chemotaxis protein